MQNKTVRNYGEPSAEEQRILNERWEKAGIGNDFIFSSVMRDQKLFLGLARLIFPDLHLTKVENHSLQQTFLGAAGSRGVRYDVYSEIDGKCFDVEMQLRNRGNDSRRTRYYQCMMDEQVLKAGKDYSALPDSYIVMISPYDAFGLGRSKYEFVNIEKSHRDLELGDGTTKVFLNTKGLGEDILPDLKHFLELVNGKKPVGEFCQEVSRQVEAAKMNAETRRNFMDFEYMRMLDRIDSRKEGRAEGLAEGKRLGTMETLVLLVKNGSLELSKAAAYANMNEDEFRKLLK